MTRARSTSSRSSRRRRATSPRPSRCSNARWRARPTSRQRTSSSRASTTSWAATPTPSASARPYSGSTRSSRSGNRRPNRRALDRARMSGPAATAAAQHPSPEVERRPRKVVRRTINCFLSLVILCAQAAAPRAQQKPAPAPTPAPPAASDRVTFEEVPPKASGIAWVHNNAHSQERYLPETVGAGCAFLDYDNDGWIDIYLVNSGPSDFFKPQTPLKNALYRNNRDGTFTDVTEKAGVAGGTFGMGAAAADFDGDGWVDLFVTAYGRNILYRNNGDGTFTDVTAKAGINSPGWSTCAVWFDFDNDGKLDLFVSSFVQYT